MFQTPDHRRHIYIQDISFEDHLCVPNNSLVQLQFLAEHRILGAHDNPSKHQHPDL